MIGHTNRQTEITTLYIKRYNSYKDKTQTNPTMDLYTDNPKISHIVLWELNKGSVSLDVFTIMYQISFSNTDDSFELCPK